MYYETSTQIGSISKIIAWMPVLIWGLVILSLTMLPIMAIMSFFSINSGEIYTMLVSLAKQANLYHLVGFADKIVHFLLFFVLGIVSVISFSLVGQRSSLRSLSLIWIGGTGYGAGTEVLQFLSSSRTPCFVDMCANAAGLTAGVFLAGFFVTLILSFFNGAATRRYGSA
jgi:VanZ family protein